MDQLVLNYCEAIAPGHNFAQVLDEFTKAGKCKFMYFFPSDRTEFRELSQLPAAAKAWTTYMFHLSGQKEFEVIKADVFTPQDFQEMENDPEVAFLSHPLPHDYCIFFNLFRNLDLEIA